MLNVCCIDGVKKRDKGLLYLYKTLCLFFFRGIAKMQGMIRVALVSLCFIGVVSSGVVVFHIGDAQALVPSLHEDEDDYNTPKWTHILRDDDEKAGFIDGYGEEDDGGCPSNTTSEMPIGDIIDILIASGIFGGVVVLAGMIAAAVALLLVMVNVMEGIKVACPVANPEYPGEAAYWDRAWKD